MRILIVDDEELIRESIEQTFTEMGKFEVSSASNGLAAYELVRKRDYDAVIVDIMMPHLNGIEFLKKLNSLGSNAIKIILSGYDKFDFAQKAIELGVSEFMLKPLPRKKIIELGERLLDAIEKKHHAVSEINELKMQIEKNKPILLERFLEELVLIGRQDSDLDQQMRYFGLVFIGDHFQVAVLNYVSSCERSEQNESDMQALGMSILRIAREHDDRQVQVLGFRAIRNSVVLIFCMKDSSSGALSAATQKLSAIIEYGSEYHTISLYGGLGRAVRGLGNIHNSYLQAQNAVRYNSLVTCTSFISIGDIEENSDIYVSGTDYDNLLSQIKLGLKDEVLAQIKEFADKTQDMGIRVEAIQLFAVKLLLACMGALSELGLEFSKDIDSILSVVRNGARPGKPGGIFQDLISMVESTMDKIASARKAKNSYLVEQALKYINEHYCEEISSKEIADSLFVSKNYLGQQFKEQTGLSIANYSNNLRIKKAMELLTSSNSKVYEVGNEVGFEDQHYFSSIFKKYTGVSPSEYRELVK